MNVAIDENGDNICPINSYCGYFQAGRCGHLVSLDDNKLDPECVIREAKYLEDEPCT